MGTFYAFIKALVSNSWAIAGIALTVLQLLELIPFTRQYTWSRWLLRNKILMVFGLLSLGVACFLAFGSEYEHRLDLEGRVTVISAQKDSAENRAGNFSLELHRMQERMLGIMREKDEQIVALRIAASEAKMRSDAMEAEKERFRVIAEDKIMRAMKRDLLAKEHAEWNKLVIRCERGTPAQYPTSEEIDRQFKKTEQQLRQNFELSFIERFSTVAPIGILIDVPRCQFERFLRLRLENLGDFIRSYQ